MSRVHLYAEFRAVPGEGGAVAALVAGYRVDVTSEPGNVLFAAHRLKNERDRFFVYEEYTDDDAFQAHVSAPYCAEFNAQIAPLVIGGGSTLTWLEEVGA